MSILEKLIRVNDLLYGGVQYSDRVVAIESVSNYPGVFISTETFLTFDNYSGYGLKNPNQRLVDLVEYYAYCQSYAIARLVSGHDRQLRLLSDVFNLKKWDLLSDVRLQGFPIGAFVGLDISWENIQNIICIFEKDPKTRNLFKSLRSAQLRHFLKDQYGFSDLPPISELPSLDNVMGE